MARQIGDINSSKASEYTLLSQIKSVIAKYGNTLFPNNSVSINGLTEKEQSFSTGTAGDSFNIKSENGIHIFNIPNASSEKKGLLTPLDWAKFNAKQEKIEKQNPSVDRCEFSENTGTSVNTESTFGGYTIQQVVQALKNANILE